MEDLQKLFDAEKYDEILAITEGRTDYDALSIRARALVARDESAEALDTYIKAVAASADGPTCMMLKITLLDGISANMEKSFANLIDHVCQSFSENTTGDIDVLKAALKVPGLYAEIWDCLNMPLPPIDFMGLCQLAGTPKFQETTDHFGAILVSAGESLLQDAIDMFQNIGQQGTTSEDTTACYARAIMAFEMFKKAKTLAALKNEKNEASRVSQCRRMLDAVNFALDTYVTISEQKLPFLIAKSEAYTEAKDLSDDLSQLMESMNCEEDEIDDEADEDEMAEENIAAGMTDIGELFRCARNARQNKKWEEAEQYYSRLRELDVQNFETQFYSFLPGLMSALSSTLLAFDPEMILRQGSFTLMESSLVCLDVFYDIAQEEEHKKIILNASDDLMSLCASNYTYNTQAQKKQTVLLFNGLFVKFREALESVAKKYPDSQKEKRRFFYELIIKQGQFLIDIGNISEPRFLQGIIMDYHKKIKEIDSNYVIPTLPANAPAKTPVSNSSDGCYVATAVYGSYDCPEVWTLRRYRDNTLAKTWYGRVFIRTYYAVSPTLVKWFGNTTWFKKLWKDKLDRMVKNLQDQGFEESPYVDKPWQSVAFKQMCSKGNRL